jgi:O-antigen/teichoic acid export membrane protein
VTKTISGPRSAAITTAALILSGGLNFLGIFVWVRVLGPRDFGIFTLVSGFGLFLNAALFEWMRGVGARTLYNRAAPYAIDPARADAILRYFCLVAAAFVAIAGICWALGVGGPGFGPAWIPLIVLFTLSEMALAMLNVTSRVRQLPWQFFAAMVARSAIAILFGLVLVLVMHLGVVGLMLGIIAAQLGTAGVMMARDPMWRALRVGRNSRDDSAVRRDVLVLGLPLVVSTALTFGSGIVDRYLVAHALGTGVVGYYTAPVDLLQKTLGFVMLALNISAYPALVRAYDDHGRAAARKVLDDAFIAQMLLGLPAVVAFAVLSSGLATLMLGKAYHAAAVQLLPWVAVAALLRFLTANHLVMVFQLERRMRLMLIPPLFTLLIVIPAGLWGMRVAGLPGMAYAALASQLVAWAICAVLAYRLLPFSLVSGDVLKIVVASGIMGAALFPFRHVTDTLGVLLICAGGGAVFLVSLLLLRLDRAAPVMAKLRDRLRRTRASG